VKATDLLMGYQASVAKPLKMMRLNADLQRSQTERVEFRGGHVGTSLRCFMFNSENRGRTAYGMVRESRK
jgi:hypothetical protein